MRSIKYLVYTLFLSPLKLYRVHHCRYVNNKISIETFHFQTNSYIIRMSREDNICWFHGKVSRERADEILLEGGLHSKTLFIDTLIHVGYYICRRASRER